MKKEDNEGTLFQAGDQIIKVSDESLEKMLNRTNKRDIQVLFVRKLKIDK